MVGMLV